MHDRSPMDRLRDELQTGQRQSPSWGDRIGRLFDILLSSITILTKVVVIVLILGALGFGAYLYKKQTDQDEVRRKNAAQERTRKEKESAEEPKQQAPSASVVTNQPEEKVNTAQRQVDDPVASLKNFCEKLHTIVEGTAYEYTGAGTKTFKKFSVSDLDAQKTNNLLKPYSAICTINALVYHSNVKEESSSKYRIHLFMEDGKWHISGVDYLYLDGKWRDHLADDPAYKKIWTEIVAQME